jgi:hypothetical protein
MNEKHIETVHYEIITGESVNYDKAPPFSTETEDFIFCVDGKDAVFKMKTHFSNLNDAQIITNEYLHQWEILIGLQHQPGDLGFRFKEVKFNQPSSKDPNILEASSTFYKMVGFDAILTHHRGSYPDPPEKFIVSPLVERMYLKFKSCFPQAELITTLGNYCLTSLENDAKGRKEAAEKFKIARKVLGKLGELCVKGNSEEARKAPKAGDFIPLTHDEREWISQVTKSLIRRTGEYAYDPTADLPLITMSDFPSLPPN